MARKFRDCNGESNGLALPPTVLQQEKFCDGNITTTSLSSQLLKERKVTTTPRYSRGEKSLKMFSKPQPGRRKSSLI